MGEVLNFRSRAQAAPKLVSLADAEHRGEWMAALAAIWANPKNWRRSRRGSCYIVINDLDICVVVSRQDEGGFKWEIRWRYGKEPTVSKWIYVGEQIAINEAWDAVVALA
jgi:hypothetical protein